MAIRVYIPAQVIYLILYEVKSVPILTYKSKYFFLYIVTIIIRALYE